MELEWIAACGRGEQLVRSGVESVPVLFVKEERKLGVVKFCLLVLRSQPLGK